MFLFQENFIIKIILNKSVFILFLIIQYDFTFIFDFLYSLFVYDFILFIFIFILFYLDRKSYTIFVFYIVCLCYEA